MILNWVSAISTAVPRFSSRRPSCLASTGDTEQLRAHLDQLHREAESTRAKANNARSRLLRLSEAAEKLRRQAAISIRSGKESDARDLLFQKKKVMQALEKSKSRIELLDELSRKLNEAISLKEGQLIGNIALDLEVSREDSANPVRIVSPKPESTEGSCWKEASESNKFELSGSEDFKFNEEGQPSIPFTEEPNELCEDQVVGGLREISSFDEFLENLDQQLSRIEVELATILRVSTVVLDSEDKKKNSKVQQTLEMLEGIHSLRKRIKSFKTAEVDMR